MTEDIPPHYGRRRQAARKLGCSDNHVNYLERHDPDFPPGVQVSKRIRLYDLSALDVYLEQKKAKTAATRTNGTTPKEQARRAASA